MKSFMQTLLHSRTCSVCDPEAVGEEEEKEEDEWSSILGCTVCSFIFRGG